MHCRRKYHAQGGIDPLLTSHELFDRLDHVATARRRYRALFRAVLKRRLRAGLATRDDRRLGARRRALRAADRESSWPSSSRLWAIVTAFSPIATDDGFDCPSK